VSPPPTLNPHGRDTLMTRTSVPAVHRTREILMKRADCFPREKMSLRRFFNEDSGQDLAEYGMLAALIAVVVIVALVTVGTAMAALWGNITAAFAGLP
jgi:Flp pilus assembly pilin Flp